MKCDNMYSINFAIVGSASYFENNLDHPLDRALDDQYWSDSNSIYKCFVLMK